MDEPSTLALKIEEHIEEQGNIDNVNVLTLSNIHEDAENIKVYAIKTQLVTYGLKNLQIADFRCSGLSEMLGFEKCFELRELHLCENNIRKIKNIEHLQKLSVLDLRGNHIIELSSKQGIQNIPKSLIQLRLGYNHLVDLNEILVKINVKSINKLWILENKFIKSKQVELMSHILRKRNLFPEDFYYN